MSRNRCNMRSLTALSPAAEVNGEQVLILDTEAGVIGWIFVPGRGMSSIKTLVRRRLCLGSSSRCVGSRVKRLARG